VAPSVLEQRRIRGAKDILPDPATRAAIARSGRGQIVGSYKLCVDARGAVSSVSSLKSTGFVDYDTKIFRELRQWGYRPYLVNGKPTAVCTSITFIYKP